MPPEEWKEEQEQTEKAKQEAIVPRPSHRIIFRTSQHQPPGESIDACQPHSLSNIRRTRKSSVFQAGVPSSLVLVHPTSVVATSGGIFAQSETTVAQVEADAALFIVGHACALTSVQQSIDPANAVVERSQVALAIELTKAVQAL